MSEQTPAHVQRVPTSMHPRQARGRRSTPLATRRSAPLAPIPEAPECLGMSDWESDPALSPAPADRSDSHLSQASTPMQGESTEWPAAKEARGRFTLRATADPSDWKSEGTHAVCRIREGVLTLGVKKRAAAGDTTEQVVAEVPLEALGVGLRRGRPNMLTLATVYENKWFDEIYCFCDDSARRDRWISVFRRMGVAISDLRD